MSDLLQELQRLGGTNAQASAVQAANAWAGTTGREFKDAINVACGTTGLEVQHALNVKAGTTQCDAALAASLISGTPSFPDLGSDLTAHWDATVGVSDTAGTVTAWADQSGNGHDLDDNDGTTPTTGSRTLNGLNVIDFNSEDPDYLMGASISHAQPFVFALAVDLDDVSGGTLFGFSNDSDKFANAGFNAGTLTVSDAAESGNPSASVSTGAHVIVVVFNGASSSIRVDGVEAGTGTHSDALDSSAFSLVFSALDGACGEFVIHAGALSTDLEDYLIARWT